MPAIDLRSRSVAALLHLAGSAFVAALVAALVFLLWYPWPYTALAGGTGLFVLITSVDAVIGPLVTFAIFARRKRWAVLRRDRGGVMLMQVAALGDGLHTTYVARPVVLALETHRFRVVGAIDVVGAELRQAPAELRTLSLTGPMVIRTLAPT